MANTKLNVQILFSAAKKNEAKEFFSVDRGTQCFAISTMVERGRRSLSFFSTKKAKMKENCNNHDAINGN